MNGLDTVNEHTLLVAENAAKRARHQAVAAASSFPELHSSAAKQKGFFSKV